MTSFGQRLGLSDQNPISRAPIGRADQSLINNHGPSVPSAAPREQHHDHQFTTLPSRFSSTGSIPSAMSQFSKRPSPGLVILGTLIDTPHPRTLRVRKNHFCIVSPSTGKITHIAPLTDTSTPIRILGEETFREYVVVWLASSQFLCPGMIDTHCHAPQYRQIGSANNLPLVPFSASFPSPCFVLTVFSSFIP